MMNPELLQAMLNEFTSRLTEEQSAQVNALVEEIEALIDESLKDLAIVALQMVALRLVETTTCEGEEEI